MASPLEKKRVKTSIYNYCKFCDYTASQKSNWERHLLTKIHKKKCHLSVTCVQKNEYKTSKNYSCEQCGKCYKSRNGLWKHSKKCKKVVNVEKTKTHTINNNIELKKGTKKKVRRFFSITKTPIMYVLDISIIVQNGKSEKSFF